MERADSLAGVDVEEAVADSLAGVDVEEAVADSLAVAIATLQEATLDEATL